MITIRLGVWKVLDPVALTVHVVVYPLNPPPLSMSVAPIIIMCYLQQHPQRFRELPPLPSVTIATTSAEIGCLLCRK